VVFMLAGPTGGSCCCFDLLGWENARAVMAGPFVLWNGLRKNGLDDKPKINKSSCSLYQNALACFC
jgi:hypothetical protein